MRLGLNLGYSGAAIRDVMPLVAAAERLDLDSVWAAEAYGADAVTVLAFLAARTERVKLGSAVLQIPARTPANAAMTAMTLDALSGGRFQLGLGMSGPQVVEGWHGVPYGRPLARTAEYVEIVRKAVAREEPLTHEGEHYRIPYTGDDASGLGRPLRSILHPVRARIPVFLAALGPRNVTLAGRIADGWLPMLYSPEREDVLVEHLDAGLAAGGRTAGDVEVAATVQVAAGEDVAACRDRLRPLLALYLGGMGARGRNFYHALACRYGYGAAADAVQAAYLDGRRREAAAAVPDAFIDEVALVGPLPRIADRLAAWRASRVDTLLLATDDPTVIEAVARASPR